MPSAAPSPKSTSAVSGWQFVLLFALTLIILLQAPLQASLWLDEAVSFWITNDSLRDALHRSFNYQGMSPLYFILLWYARQVFGQSEFMLRLPSLLACAASCGFLYAITRDLFNRYAALLAVLFFICLDSTQKFAFSARPYAAAILCALWSVYALLHWLRGSPRSSQLEYLFATALTIYFQYLYAPIVLIHIAFVLALGRADKTKCKRFFFFILPCLAIALIPGLYQMRMLAQKSSSMQFMVDSSLADLGSAILPMNIIAYLGIAILFSAVYDRPRWVALGESERRSLAVLLLWLVFPALWLFVYSHVTSGSLFVDRFYAWSAPAAAILLAWLASHIEPQRCRRNIFLVVAFMAGVRELQHQWNLEDWRGAVAKVNADPSEGPILTYSGLIESEQLEWFKDPEKSAFLRAPFSPYPLRQESIVLPGSFEDPAATRYIQETLNSPQAPLDRFVLICLHIKHEVQPGVWKPVEEYLREYFEKQGFKASTLQDKNLVRVIQFQRSGL
ncbi:MAG: glycosyltransferase family 39 protein [Deltaproteobacteria bacterium]|nr:glycosyltransferase family 39 protein [Deltaproteobacteria bacterium]